MKASAATVALLAVLFVPTAALAQSAAPSAGEAPSLSVELNKLEPIDNGCRVYVVVDNQSSISYGALKLDLILFAADGVIARRNALDLAPLRPNKRHVKTFDLDAPPCDGIGNMLINDVIECEADDVAAADCFDRVTATSRSGVQFSK